MGAHRKLAPRE